eukprot:CAMPEP_0194043622 /NCGR_PEP_ID=MMETSP0009_2-20130614/15221_1 /TAXON_ID=210454 /ORGANISM="Grammatophora oceanica, Strain CCMP 410" /LENGTH=49 /DNA_ID= /DNA_START= /DNA_END= /DNA_ORIENTATION=
MSAGSFCGSDASVLLWLGTLGPENNLLLHHVLGQPKGEDKSDAPTKSRG